MNEEAYFNVVGNRLTVYAENWQVTIEAYLPEKHLREEVETLEKLGAVRASEAMLKEVGLL